MSTDINICLDCRHVKQNARPHDVLKCMNPYVASIDPLTGGITPAYCSQGRSANGTCKISGVYWEPHIFTIVEVKNPSSLQEMFGLEKPTEPVATFEEWEKVMEGSRDARERAMEAQRSLIDFSASLSTRKSTDSSGSTDSP